MKHPLKNPLSIWQQVQWFFGWYTWYEGRGLYDDICEKARKIEDPVRRSKFLTSRIILRYEGFPVWLWWKISGPR